MLVRLTRNRRTKAGWFVALIYLLCIMAPTLSYALPGERIVVPCISMESAMPSSMHMDGQDVRPMHAHLGEQIHDHSAHFMAMAGDVDQSLMAAATGADMAGDEAPSKKGAHSTGGQCCAQMCVSAMPASLVDFALPTIPTLVRIAVIYRTVADNAPAVHYRPPIS